MRACKLLRGTSEADGIEAKSEHGVERYNTFPSHKIKVLGAGEIA